MVVTMGRAVLANANEAQTSTMYMYVYEYVLCNIYIPFRHLFIKSDRIRSVERALGFDGTHLGR